MKRYQPNSGRIERTALPLPISEHHKYVKLYIDFFFVNVYPFLDTKSAKWNFVTANPYKSRYTSKIRTVLDMVLDKYDDCDFNVTTTYGDNEFKIAKLKA